MRMSAICAPRRHGLHNSRPLPVGHGRGSVDPAELSGSQKIPGAVWQRDVRTRKTRRLAVHGGITGLMVGRAPWEIPDLRGLSEAPPPLSRGAEDRYHEAH